MTDRVVVDASTLIDLMLEGSAARGIAERIEGSELHAPAHIDAEVLSALGRIHRAGQLEAAQVEALLDDLASAPLERHTLEGLVERAWRRRHNLSLLDALYIALAERLETVTLTRDAGMAMASEHAELIRG